MGEKLILQSEGLTENDVDSIIERAQKISAETLNLRGNELGEKGGGALCDRLNEELPTVRNLVLASCGVECRGAVQLAQQVADGGCALESIHLGANRIGDWGACTLGESLDKTSKLTGLYLGGNRIEDGGLKGLVKDYRLTQV